MTQPIKPPAGTTGPVGVTPNAHDGWGQLRWAVNRHWPQAMLRARTYQRHAARLVRQKMRVR